MKDAKSVNTPIGAHFKLKAVKEEDTELEYSYMKDVPYSNAVGSIMFSMVSTRPDIAYGLGLISRFMSKPSREHWQAVKWLLRYLKETKKLKLVYSRSQQSTCEVIGYCDSDYAADLDKRRSLSGYVFTVGGNVVSWKSSLQHVIALSTTEAEYISLTEAVKEALWIKGFVNELGYEQNSAKVFCDSRSAIHLSKNTVFHERTKHIDVRLHFVREIITRDLVSIKKINTKINPADMLTKVIPVNKLKDALGLLNMRE
ncbi:secreted RxLR effector protein 161-like [Primulina eburnea]|uniref:secreted RxLR effector protein 161-like n=1 Tax=Primulina eburnea TaxID=1245227 RepID=UPI003C6C69DE